MKQSTSIIIVMLSLLLGYMLTISPLAFGETARGLTPSADHSGRARMSFDKDGNPASSIGPCGRLGNHDQNGKPLPMWPEGDPCDTLWEWHGWDECNELDSIL